MLLEDRFLQMKIDALREPAEPTERPIMLAGRATGVAQPPESIGEFVSDVAVPLGGMVEMGAATAKGMAQGFAGLPGDLEGLTRTVINLLGGNVDENTKMPTTEEIKQWLDQFPITRVGDGKNPYETIGEFAAPGGYVKGAKAATKAVKKATKGAE